MDSLQIWTVCRFDKRGLGEKKGEVFLRGVDTPTRTMGKVGRWEILGNGGGTLVIGE